MSSIASSGISSSEHNEIAEPQTHPHAVALAHNSLFEPCYLTLLEPCYLNSVLSTVVTPWDPKYCMYNKSHTPFRNFNLDIER